MTSRTLLSLSLLSLILAPACKSEGTIEGQLTPATSPEPSAALPDQPTEPDLSNEAEQEEQPAPQEAEDLQAATDPATRADRPVAKHEQVSFTWKEAKGKDKAHSGTIETTLPDGETFEGQYHEIIATTTIETIEGFYGSWYGDPWADWTWGGAWPRYATTTEYLSYYTGHIVALLGGNRGTTMRCDFQVADATRGLKSGGEGECQLSNGDRITAVFAAT